jgi:hypothetical protein
MDNKIYKIVKKKSTVDKTEPFESDKHEGVG